MSQTAALVVKDVLGFQRSPDGAIALIGLQQPTGEQFALAISVDKIWDIVTGLVAAASAPDGPEVDGKVAVAALYSNWFQVNTTTEGFLLRLRLESGGDVPFHLAKDMTQRLAEVLVSVAGLPSTVQEGREGTPQ
ncbi:hypothetical protein V5F79_22080 [Xanthobacter flavus]|uniref:hypothetical protein n=1 Tax=Xanthobacter flavus TaxID=281 RepID=UPI00372775F8